MSLWARWVGDHKGRYSSRGSQLKQSTRWRKITPINPSHHNYMYVANNVQWNQRLSNLQQNYHHHFTTKTSQHTKLIVTTLPLLRQKQQQQQSLRLISMATSVSAATGFTSSFHGNWGTSIVGEDYTLLAKTVTTNHVRISRRPVRLQPMMKNVNEGKGVFAPVVVIARDIIGKKRFNQLRGKAIALHSQVITEFCKSIGADAKQRQGLIRLAKKNGERLGFLA